MAGSGVSRGLALALVAAGGSAVASPLIVRWVYDDWNVFVIGLATAFLGPVIVCDLMTIRQQRDGLVTSFDPKPLTISSALATFAALAVTVFGLGGAALDLLVVPVAGMFLAVAWVQPRRRHVVVTALLGGTLVVLVAWFAGRADEYWYEAIASGLLIIGALVALVRLRDRGVAPARAHP